VDVRAPIEVGIEGGLLRRPAGESERAEDGLQVLVECEASLWKMSAPSALPVNPKDAASASR
jgi:hypothetical protein